MVGTTYGEILNPVSTCTTAECTSDADCVTNTAPGICQIFWGAYKGPNYGNYPYIPTFKCYHKGDACRTNADCPGDAPFKHWCSYPDGATGPTCAPPLGPPPSAAPPSLQS